MARTGIDLGTGSVKLVRGVGKTRLERITHIGLEEWNPADESGGQSGPVVAALGRLLQRLGLGRGALGRVAVAMEGEEASLKEVLLPALSADDLRRALPFEAKKHLIIESMSAPLLDFQILGDGPPSEEGGRQVWVLLAAAPSAQRDFSLHVLAKNGIEPEVVEVEPLAALNSLSAEPMKQAAPDVVHGLLDLGGRHAALVLKGQPGSLLSRPVGPSAPRTDDPTKTNGYAEALIEGIRETLTFYRGRHRADVDAIHVCGGGSLREGIVERLAGGLRLTVDLLDPLGDLADAASGIEEAASSGPRFSTAVGLARWWDVAP